MTEERKEELRKLIKEAINHLVIRVRFESGTISKEKYIEILRKRHEFYGISNDHLDNYHYLLYQPDISKEKTKADLLEFIRKELNQVIEDDKIGYTVYNVDRCAKDGFSLVKRIIPLSHNLSDISDVLEHLLKIAFAFGIDKAVSSFEEDSKSEGRYSLYHSITSLEGIGIESKIEINNRIRLVPLPQNIEYQLNHSIYNRHRRGRDKGTTLLIIDCPRYGLFHKPSETNPVQVMAVNLPNQVQDDEFKLSNQGMIMDFRETFCQALSLACNTMVMFDYFWDFSSIDVFRSDDVDRKIWYLGPIGRKVEVGQTEIEQAKHIYKILEKCDEKTKGIFWIASERWRRSKTSQTAVDKMIDLGIAFESLFVSNRHEISSQLRNNASRYLGKNKVDQEKLKKEFKAIYDCRCDAVHEGKLEENIKIGGKVISISKFITNAQNLCRDSILKILEDGKFPDWNNLKLG